MAEAAPRLAGLDTDQRRAQHLACPLLGDGACSLYEARPFACRGLYSTSAEACEAALLTPPGQPRPQIRSPAVPRALAAVFGAGINAGLADHGLQNETLELTTALDTLQRDPAAAGRWLSGERVFAPANVS